MGKYTGKNVLKYSISISKQTKYKYQDGYQEAKYFKYFSETLSFYIRQLLSILLGHAALRTCFSRNRFQESARYFWRNPSKNRTRLQAQMRQMIQDITSRSNVTVKMRGVAGCSRCLITRKQRWASTGKNVLKYSISISKQTKYKYQYKYQGAKYYLQVFQVFFGNSEL